MTDEPRTERVTIMMSPSEVRALDDWSFENRIRSRSEAARRIIQQTVSPDPNPEKAARRMPKRERK